MDNEIIIKPLTREQQLEWEVQFLKELKEEIIGQLEEAEKELVKVKKKNEAKG
jgi:hypothetical protein